MTPLNMSDKLIQHKTFIADHRLKIFNGVLHSHLDFYTSQKKLLIPAKKVNFLSPRFGTRLDMSGRIRAKQSAGPTLNTNFQKKHTTEGVHRKGIISTRD